MYRTLHKLIVPARSLSRFFASVKKGKDGYVIYLVLVVTFILGIYVDMVLTVQYMNTVNLKRKISALQATICANSGLSVAQARAGRGGEESGFRQTMEDGGSFYYSAQKDAGWQRVSSKGVFFKDTVVLSGVLGQVPPAFAKNALNITASNPKLVVADRAKLIGNMGSRGGDVVLKGTGELKGKTTGLKRYDFDDKLFVQELVLAQSMFREKREGVASQDTIASLAGDFSKRDTVFIGSMHLAADTIDRHGGFIKVPGDLVIEKKSVLKNARVYVRGDIIIKDDASVQSATLLALGKIRICDRATVRGNIVGADTIEIKNNVRLQYPSLVYTGALPGNNYYKPGVIIVQDNAVIKGVVATGKFTSDEYNVRIMVLGRSRIEGMVLSPAPITLYGSVNGSIYTAKILYRQERNIYENWLMETTVTGRDVSAMTIPILFPGESNSRYLRIEKLSGR